MRRSKIYLPFIALLFIFSCSEDKEVGTSKLIVSLVDAPADYEHVFIDIQDIQVNLSDEETEDGWTSLEQAEMGVYDILELTNGTEALLGELDLPAGNLGQIRLILGENNNLIIEEDTIVLTVPSGSQSGLKLNIGSTIEPGFTYKLIIDFDAAKSIVKAGNSGKYSLKPVIRASFEAATGAISGTYSPDSIGAVIYAIQGSDSISTFPDNGDFLIRALPEGNYTVSAVSDSFEKAITVENVEVLVGEVTILSDTLKFD